MKSLNCFGSYQEHTSSNSDSQYMFSNFSNEDKLTGPTKISSTNNSVRREIDSAYFVNKKNSKLLPSPYPEDKYKKCCVIDLDETLVHSSFRELQRYDFKISVEIDGIYHDIFIVKRPFVDIFLDKMKNLYECILFTASLSKYANPVCDLLDKTNCFRHRLFRESCVFYRGGFVKDLSMLGRPIDQIVILDNSPISFLFNTFNAVQIISWFDNPKDRALTELIPYFERMAQSPSVSRFIQLEAPPISATWPISEIPPNIIPYETPQASNPITSVSPPELVIPNPPRVKQTSRSSFKNKSFYNVPPSIRSLFSRASSKVSTDVPTPIPLLADRTVKGSSSATSKSSKLSERSNSPKPEFNPHIMNKSPVNIATGREVTSSSQTPRNAYNPSIKQNLNSSSSDIFSPKYEQLGISINHLHTGPRKRNVDYSRLFSFWNFRNKQLLQRHKRH